MRCFHCNKKIRTIEFLCKCKETFCAKCRHPESHNCTFDFKSDQKKKLLKVLTKVEAPKVIKI